MCQMNNFISNFKQRVFNTPLLERIHYNDVIMSAMASQITSLTIVCSTVYSGADHRKYQSSASLAFGLCMGNSPVTDEFPPQRVGNAENVSILMTSSCQVCWAFKKHWLSPSFYISRGRETLMWKTLNSCLDKQPTELKLKKNEWYIGRGSHDLR